MTTYGLTATGFVRKPLSVIREDIEAALTEAFGVNINLDTDSVFGKLVGTLSQPIADVWEELEAVYNAFIPSSAEGTSQDGCCDLVGVQRNAAVTSKVTEVIEGVVATVIADAFKIATETVGDQFETMAEATLSASAAVCADTSLIGSVTNGKTYTITLNGNDYTYVATVPSDDADAVGAALKLAIDTAAVEPVTVTDNGDGDLRILGTDDANGLPTPFTIAVNANVRIDTVGNLVACESSTAGPVIAYAGTLTSIVTPQSGVTAAWNPLDATLGNAEELDSALRARRTESLAVPGAGTVDSVYANLAAIDEVTACIVLENTTDETDANGLLPHSMHAVVEGGDVDEIAAVLWERKGGGIGLNGSESTTVTDTQGFKHAMKYDRPTPVLLWVRVSYTTYDEEDFPANGEAGIAAAALTFGNALSVGRDVLPDRFKGPIFDAVAGIETLTVEVAEDSGGSPGTYQETPWVIEFTERAMFDSGRIVVQEV